MRAQSVEISAADFFRQIEDFARDFRDAPLFKIWIGTVPFVILIHAETVEVLWLRCFDSQHHVLPPSHVICKFTADSDDTHSPATSLDS